MCYVLGKELKIRQSLCLQSLQKIDIEQIVTSVVRTMQEAYMQERILTDPKTCPKGDSLKIDLDKLRKEEVGDGKGGMFYAE